VGGLLVRVLTTDGEAGSVGHAVKL